MNPTDAEFEAAVKIVEARMAETLHKHRHDGVTPVWMNFVVTLEGERCDAEWEFYSTYPTSHRGRGVTFGEMIENLERPKDETWLESIRIHAQAL